MSTEERIKRVIDSLDAICSACMAATSQETWDMLHREPRPCGHAMNPTLTVRWWMHDTERLLPRDDRRHFNLSEVPRGDRPELDAFVAHWRDTIGFQDPRFAMRMVDFE